MMKTDKTRTCRYRPLLAAVLLHAFVLTTRAQEEESQQAETVAATTTALRDNGDGTEIVPKVWKGRAIKTRGSPTIYYVPEEGQTRYEVSACELCGIDFCNSFEVVTIDELESLSPAKISLTCDRIPGAPKPNPPPLKKPSPKKEAADPLRKPTQKMIGEPSDEFPCGRVEMPSDASALRIGSKISFTNIGSRSALHVHSGLRLDYKGKGTRTEVTLHKRGKDSDAWTDKNEVWIVRGGYQTCMPENTIVGDNEFVMLQNEATGCYLHSSSEYVSKDSKRNRGHRQLACVTDPVPETDFAFGPKGGRPSVEPSEIIRVDTDTPYMIMSSSKTFSVSHGARRKDRDHASLEATTSQFAKRDPESIQRKSLWILSSA